MAEFRGEMKPALRVRIPPPKGSHGQPAVKAAAPPPAPAAAAINPTEVEADEDFDDEINI